MTRSPRIRVLVAFAGLAGIVLGSVACNRERAEDVVRDGGNISVWTKEFEFDPPSFQARGAFTVRLTNAGNSEHFFVIEGEEPGPEGPLMAPKGETAQASFDLEPGEYTFYCSSPGHREEGMSGTLTVGPAAD